MPTHCFNCQHSPLDTLMHVVREGEPPGEPYHNIVYRHIMIERCPRCGGAQIERLDHDCFDVEDVWDQYEWYRLDANGVAQLAAYVVRCPQPLVADCTCDVHGALRAAIERLPRREWSTALEAEEHIHAIHWAELGV